MKRAVIVNLQVEGTHRWETCNLPEVAYLRYPHRHIFHITMEKQVQHNDRDVEIIMLKRRAERWLRSFFGVPNNGCIDFGNLSCEAIAEALLEHFDLLSCQVLEDNENGAKLYANDIRPTKKNKGG